MPRIPPCPLKAVIKTQNILKETMPLKLPRKDTYAVAMGETKLVKQSQKIKKPLKGLSSYVHEEGYSI
jgi:hypothetical protein